MQNRIFQNSAKFMNGKTKKQIWYIYIYTKNTYIHIYTKKYTAYD